MGQSPAASIDTAQVINVRRAIPLLALTLALLPGADIRADEGGVSFWLPGQYASFAATPGQPGWSLPITLYYYNGNASASKTFSRGDALNVGLDSQGPLFMLSPTWVPDQTLFGGQLSLSLTLGYGWNSTQANLSLLPSSASLNRGDTDAGGTDLYPLASLAWSSGVNNWMVYVTGDLPVGSYSSTRLSNIGIGHTAVNIGGAYTYLNTNSGFEASATLGVTYNGMNSSTNYQNGVDSHLDWDLSRLLPANWQVGVAGYVYYQLTGDSGSGDHVGSFKSRVASIGPEVGCTFTVGGQ